MIEELENGCRRTGTQRAGQPRAQGGNTAEKRATKKTQNSPRIHTASSSFPHQDSCCQEGLYPALPLGEWTKFYKSDPRITLGKYSPLEKEILRLGGLHTVAARRFLANKQEEERKMLKELHLSCPGYKQAKEYKKHPSFPCSVCGPLEKIWTAKVVVRAEEFKMPQREKITISKHVERMKLARALGNKQLLPHFERFRNSAFLPGAGPRQMERDKGKEEGDGYDSDHSGNAKQEEDGETERPATQRREIKMNVIFKSEEGKKCVVCRPNDCKPFLPVKKPERFITGLTNRNLLPIADFPGDLMLMNQNFTSRGIHPSEATKTYWLQEEGTYKQHMYTAAPYLD